MCYVVLTKPTKRWNKDNKTSSHLRWELAICPNEKSVREKENTRMEPSYVHFPPCFFTRTRCTATPHILHVVIRPIFYTGYVPVWLYRIRRWQTWMVLMLLWRAASLWQLWFCRLALTHCAGETGLELARSKVWSYDHLLWDCHSGHDNRIP